MVVFHAREEVCVAVGRAEHLQRSDDRDGAGTASSCRAAAGPRERRAAGL